MHFNIQTAVRYSQLAVFCLTVILFPGCGASDNSRTKLEFWAVGSEVEKIGELLDEFRRENPDVELRIQQIPCAAAPEKLLTAFAVNATPDGLH